MTVWLQGAARTDADEAQTIQKESGMMRYPDTRDWWIALVTFERLEERHTEFLPDGRQGAVGWMACYTSKEENLRDMLEAALRADGLRLVEIGGTEPVESWENVETLDSHLAANIAALEPGKPVVWGTIRVYRADGTA